MHPPSQIQTPQQNHSLMNDTHGEEGLRSKVVLLGASSVGKTALITRAVNNTFEEHSISTVGAAFKEMTVRVGDRGVTLMIWDTAGQEQFRSLAPLYHRGANIVVIVFSIIDDCSLVDAENWATEVREQQGDNQLVLFLVGNKIDLEDERIISFDRGVAMAKKIGAQYLEVSAKTAMGVKDMFFEIAKNSVKALDRTDVQDAIPLGDKQEGKRKVECC